jgi:hypothetical protein
MRQAIHIIGFSAALLVALFIAHELNSSAGVWLAYLIGCATRIQ